MTRRSESVQIQRRKHLPTSKNIGGRLFLTIAACCLGLLLLGQIIKFKQYGRSENLAFAWQKCVDKGEESESFHPVSTTDVLSLLQSANNHDKPRIARLKAVFVQHKTLDDENLAYFCDSLNLMRRVIAKIGPELCPCPRVSRCTRICGLDKQRSESTLRLPRINITIQSNDYHTGLVSDLKHFLPTYVSPILGEHVTISWIDNSFSSYCAIQNPPTCAKSYIGMSRHTAWSSCPTQQDFLRQVWEHNKNTSESHMVDAFFASLPVCLLLPWIPFGKPVIAVEGTHWIGGVTENCPQTFQTLAKTNSHLFGRNNEAMDMYYDTPASWNRSYIPSVSAFHERIELPAPHLVNRVYVYVHTKGGTREPHFNIKIDQDRLSTLLKERESLRCDSLSYERCNHRDFIVQDLMAFIPDFNLSKLAQRHMGEADHVVIVSTCFQVTFMSGTEMYATDIPLWHPRPVPPWETQFHRVADYMNRPGVGLYENEDDLANDIVFSDLHLRWTVISAWNKLYRDILASVWASHLRRLFPGLETGTYVRPNPRTSLSFEDAWYAALGRQFIPSNLYRSCDPPDSVVKNSPHI